MNVLIIYGMPNPNNLNRRIHYGILDKLGKFCNTKIIESAKGQARNIEKSLRNTNADVVLMYYTRTAKGLINIPYNKYKTKNKKNKKFKKIYIENDYNGGTVKYFKKNNFDLCIQRGSFKNDGLPFPTVWLPFSADENVFKTKPMNKKRNIVGISASLGSHNSKVYAQRKKMVDILSKDNLIRKGKGNRDQKYIDFISSVTIGLTSTEWNRFNNPTTTPHAKMWEYMASKTVVLTPPFEGMIEIFGKNYSDYICVCKEDLSDLKKKAKYLLKNKKERVRLAENAYKLFLEDHTDIKRSEELYNIVKSVHEGKEIPRKWGR